MKKQKKVKEKAKNPKKHLGISMDLVIYHPRRSITPEEVDRFADAIIRMVERRGWYSGGGWHLVDINKKGNVYINLTPKHIKKFDLDV